jgi:hypothetical protein
MSDTELNIANRVIKEIIDDEGNNYVSNHEIAKKLNINHILVLKIFELIDQHLSDIFSVERKSRSGKYGSLMHFRKRDKRILSDFLSQGGIPDETVKSIIPHVYN